MVHTIQADLQLNHGYDALHVQKPSMCDDLLNVGHHPHDQLNHANHEDDVQSEDTSHMLTTHHDLYAHNACSFHYNDAGHLTYGAHHHQYVCNHHDLWYEHAQMHGCNNGDHVEHIADACQYDGDVQHHDDRHTCMQYLHEIHDGADEIALMLDPADMASEFVEVDPDNRYDRYRELIGKGAVKRVYRGFDKQEGIEVAWNQVSLHHVSHVKNEIHLLRTLKHPNIIKIYKVWVDQKHNKINFITELCSNTLLGFRQQHRHICMKAIKDWARQILQALMYLHRQSPPIIHGDLKCENIFVNCSDGKIKLGDFGSAAPLGGSGHLHTLVGTPEFMAPEMYMENYNELVDVYAFGMCMIELLTVEIPYMECKNVAQIYQKVKAGVAPEVFHKIKDVETLSFVRKCLAPVMQRPSAAELLMDPFLICNGSALPGIGINTHLPRSPILTKSASSPNLDRVCIMPFVNRSRQKNLASHSSFIKERSRQAFIVFGKIENDSKVMMRLRIVQSDESAPIHVEFPYDCTCDTPEIVAEEMVQELEFAKSDFALLADLIASALASLTQGKLGIEDARLEEAIGPSKCALTSQVARCLEVVV